MGNREREGGNLLGVGDLPANPPSIHPSVTGLMKTSGGGNSEPDLEAAVNALILKDLSSEYEMLNQVTL